MKSISEFALSYVQQLVPYVPGKPIEELERELGLSNIIKLASNENPLGPSKKALAAIQASLPQLSLYPDGNGFNLKRALAKKHGIGEDQITLGNGSNELLELVARLFLSPGSEAVFSQHAFAIYAIVSQAAGAKLRSVSALNFGHDLTAMLACVNENTRIVFIANPNNPTGTLLSQQAVESFLKALPVHCLCVLDEAYFEFVHSQENSDSVAWLATYPNLIITRTFSKAYGLAGLRIGYGISSVALADLLNRVRQPFNNNTLALVAAEAALSDDEHLQATLKVNREGMLQLTEGFRRLGLTWIPSYGNFVAVDIKRPGLPVYEALLRKSVIVRPIGGYEMPNHLRVSIGTATENDTFLTALADCL
ncbi:MAG: histidinol-phosphate transaminase [Methylococcaceae bacterium]|jgi:histidinol-phosphate aminotransferase